jgi:hypothetical protein
VEVVSELPSTLMSGYEYTTLKPQKEINIVRLL